MFGEHYITTFYHHFWVFFEWCKNGPGAHLYNRGTITPQIRGQPYIKHPKI